MTKEEIASQIESINRKYMTVNEASQDAEVREHLRWMPIGHTCEVVLEGNYIYGEYKAQEFKKISDELVELLLTEWRG